jgi:hypothetical protein
MRRRIKGMAALNFRLGSKVIIRPNYALQRTVADHTML